MADTDNNGNGSGGWDYGSLASGAAQVGGSILNARSQQAAAETAANANIAASRSAYHVDPAAYNYAMGVPGWASSEVDRMYGQGRLGDAAGQQYADRQAIMQALDAQRRRSAGEGLISSQIAQRQQGQAAGDVAAQMAARRASPLGARQGMDTVSGMGQQVASLAAPAAAKEAAGAGAEYMKALEGLRTQDVGREMALGRLHQGWGALGLADKDRQSLARRGLEEDRLKSNMRGFWWEDELNELRPGGGTGDPVWDAWNAQRAQAQGVAAGQGEEERRKQAEADALRRQQDEDLLASYV